MKGGLEISTAVPKKAGNAHLFTLEFDSTTLAQSRFPSARSSTNERAHASSRRAFFYLYSFYVRVESSVLRARELEVAGGRHPRRERRGGQGRGVAAVPPQPPRRREGDSTHGGERVVILCCCQTLSDQFRSDQIRSDQIRSSLYALK